MRKKRTRLRDYYRSPYLYGLEHIITLHQRIGEEVARIGSETRTVAPRLDEQPIAPGALTSKILAVTKKNHTTHRMEEIS